MRDTHDLHEFLVREIGALRVVQTVETSLMARRAKQAGSIMTGPRVPELSERGRSSGPG